MKNINLAAIPNQSLSILLDDGLYDIKIRQINKTMIIDIIRDGEEIIMGERLLTGTPLIKYDHLEKGNFILISINHDLADWTKFNSTQKLIYLTRARIEAIKNGTI